MQRLDSAIGIPIYKPNTIEPDTLVSMSPTPRPSTDPQSPQLHSQSQSRLLSLPAELQLLIWEHAVIQFEPLCVNGPCDSSFGGWNESYYADKVLWENGTKKPPQQPPLTLVCRRIRTEALPIFYKHNHFQSGYCYETNMDMTLKWLRGIGAVNRRLMRHFYFFDANWMHDVNCAKDLKNVRRGPVVKEMGGAVESSYSETGARHDVLFERKVEDEELEGLVALFEGTNV